MNKLIVPVLLILGCVFLFAFNLGDLSLLKGDENYYFSASKRMIADGDFITPRYHHHIRFEKPPLYYWLVALFFKLFGVSWAIARSTSVLFGALTVLLLYLTALRFFPKKTAILSAIILATSFLFFHYARIAVIDMTFLFLVTLSFFLFIKGEQDDKSWPFLLSFAALGLSVLAKGPLGVIVFLLVAMIYTLSSRKFNLFRRANPLLGVFIVLLIALPWPYLMYKIHGQLFIDHIWKTEAIDKVVGSLLNINQAGNILWFVVKYLGYYVPVVLLSFAPWSILLPFGLAKKLNTKRPEDARFIMLWFWTIFIFFTVVSFKHTHYMLLLAPPLAMIVANFMANKRITAILASATIITYIFLVGFIFPSLESEALRNFSLVLASEIEEQDEEIGMASKGFNLKKMGIYLNNLASDPYHPTGDDLAQYIYVNSSNITPFLSQKKRAYCLITKADYEKIVPQGLKDKVYILNKSTKWKRFKLKRHLPLILAQDWDNLKEEAYLISNRRQ